MKKRVLFLIISLLSTYLFAEKIDGPAYIRSQAQGVVMFTLFDNVEVDCSDLDYGWYKIGIHIKVTKQQWDLRTVYRGSKLYSIEGTVIGEVQEDCQIEVSEDDEKELIARIIGYAFKSNIKQRSIAEMQLMNLFPHFDSLTVKSFDTFFEEFKFENKGIFSGDTYQEFMMFEAWVTYEIPKDRLRFIFSDNTLLAIIHSRDLSLGDYKTYDISKTRKIILFRDIPDNELALLLRKNREIYMSGE